MSAPPIITYPERTFPRKDASDLASIVACQREAASMNKPDACARWKQEMPWRSIHWISRHLPRLQGMSLDEMRALTDHDPTGETAVRNVMEAA